MAIDRSFFSVIAQGVDALAVAAGAEIFGEQTGGLRTPLLFPRPAPAICVF